jgi:hypothetical protein
MTLVARLIVLGAAGYFLALGLVALVAPQRVSRFLMGFATSWPTHLLELGVRAAVGLGFLGAAPHAAVPALFRGFGWLLLVTTAGLALVPWQRHRQFTERHVPQALQYLPLIGVASLLIGAGIAWAVLAVRQ